MKKIGFLLMFLSGLGLNGCAGTDYRIKENKEVFSSATPTQQEMIKEGKIAVGFSAEYVELALGKPDKITYKTDQNGQTVVWHYFSSRVIGGSSWVYGGYPYLYNGFYAYPYYYQNTVDEEKTTVYLKDNIVISYEENKENKEDN